MDEREIDLVDMLWDWSSHWRSVLLVLLIGCIASIGLICAS